MFIPSNDCFFTDAREPSRCETDIFWIYLHAHGFPSVFFGGNECATGAGKGVQDSTAWRATCPDDSGEELLGHLRRMGDPLGRSPSAPCSYSGYVPQAGHRIVCRPDVGRVLPLRVAAFHPVAGPARALTLVMGHADGFEVKERRLTLFLKPEQGLVSGREVMPASGTPPRVPDNLLPEFHRVEGVPEVIRQRKMLPIEGLGVAQVQP